MRILYLDIPYLKNRYEQRSNKSCSIMFFDQSARSFTLFLECWLSAPGYRSVIVSRIVKKIYLVVYRQLLTATKVRCLASILIRLSSIKITKHYESLNDIAYYKTLWRPKNTPVLRSFQQHKPLEYCAIRYSWKQI